MNIRRASSSAALECRVAFRGADPGPLQLAAVEEEKACRNNMKRPEAPAVSELRGFRRM
jgi:hypothetical protein